MNDPTQLDERHGLPETTVADEIANTLTHGLGLVFSIVATSVMIYQAWQQYDALAVAACAIFGGSLTLVYGSSTIYHAVRSAPLKRFMRVVDHAAIYILIAGTYTPFALISLRSSWGWPLFGVVWTLGVMGVIQKLRKKNRHKDAGLVLYMVMGWMALFVIKPFVEIVPNAGLAWLFGGGVVYTAGVLFYSLQRRYAHAVWHLFVMGGSFCHVMAVLYYVIPG